MPFVIGLTNHSRKKTLAHNNARFSNDKAQGNELEYNILKGRKHEERTNENSKPQRIDQQIHRRNWNTKKRGFRE